ncbi:hypothetical protein [Nocardia sp. CA-119907]|uniref:hypothetical protein n=1 Tax=Nocardia sp. CA-119907 TaxID=3239973 RepID=UPI003D960861
MEYEPGQGMTRNEIKYLLEEVLGQYGPTVCAEPSIFKKGNESTLWLFGGLQFLLRSRDLSKFGPVRDQALPAEIRRVHGDTEGNTADDAGHGYVLVFLKEIPAYAVTATIVHSGKGPDQTAAVCPGTRPEIPLDNPGQAIAVRLSDHEQVRLVTFVTHAPDTLPAVRPTGSIAQIDSRRPATP